jgi:hypothetical protein
MLEKADEFLSFNLPISRQNLLAVGGENIKCPPVEDLDRWHATGSDG